MTHDCVIVTCDDTLNPNPRSKIENKTKFTISNSNKVKLVYIVNILAEISNIRNIYFAIESKKTIYF